MANTNTPNLQEPDLTKEDWRVIWGFLALFGLVAPIAMPVTAILAQVMVWQYVLAGMPQVTFSFGFLESCLLVICISLSAILINIGITQLVLLKSGKTFKEYSLAERRNREAKMAELKEQKKLFDSSTVSKYLVYFARQFALLSICLVAASHYLPGKLGFESIGALLNCAFVLTGIREMLCLFWSMILSFGVDRLKERFPQAAQTAQEGNNDL
ncbi:MAG TPA: hypothetical protein PKN86_02545 [Candidatus Obscuribacter sp.]|nr:hypothetical protein [Candidatus Obscuribacter sp.]MBL8083126.1 hypothetical protein [Candidatus Obscuribacter sp.]HMW89889.1 hypothetical protein [Candidatus Obscuribacter sp.]HMX45463.1 hypothetical protein [Candidatus Obscuribacter sp.]HMY04846.1 hypothetical protein [Candidatus Obscuribacter sp.]